MRLLHETPHPALRATFSQEKAIPHPPQAVPLPQRGRFGYDVTYSYTYDNNGNILSVNGGGNTVSYVYDSQNQLIRENNQSSDFTRTWTYDSAGNILSAQSYDYSTGALGGHRTTANYAYGDSDWRDLLTEFNGQAITYDGIGNPTFYRSNTLTWEHGRELTSLSDGATTWTYTYDADGMRTQRTNGNTTYNYVYNGSQLVQMTADGHTLNFTYDADGMPLSVTLDGTVYYYITNIQGDVIGIRNANGSTELVYRYDAWGRLMYTNNSISPIALNPLRYRGYVYDVETDLYYLQSRYYDPYTGRFINADIFTSTSGSLCSSNMFAYCENNPVMRSDSTGHWFGLDDLIAAGVGAIVNVASQFVTDVVESVTSGSWQLSNWQTYVGSFVGGAVGGIATLYCGPVAGAAIGAGSSTLFGQTLENVSGGQQRSAATIALNVATDSFTGAFFEKYLSVDIPGVNSGRNSMSAVYKSGLTKIGNGTARKMSIKVIGKGVVSGIVGGIGPSIITGINNSALKAWQSYRNRETDAFIKSLCWCES